MFVQTLKLYEMKVELDDLITPKEFAKLKGTTPSAITNGMTAGLIPFVQIKGARLILLDEETKLYRPKRDFRRLAKIQIK